MDSQSNVNIYNELSQRLEVHHCCTLIAISWWVLMRAFYPSAPKARGWIPSSTPIPCRSPYSDRSGASLVAPGIKSPQGSGKSGGLSGWQPDVDEQADIATWLRPKGPIFKGDAEAVEERKALGCVSVDVCKVLQSGLLDYDKDSKPCCVCGSHWHLLTLLVKHVKLFKAHLLERIGRRNFLRRLRPSSPHLRSFRSRP